MSDKAVCKINYALAGINLGLMITNILRYIIFHNISTTTFIMKVMLNICAMIITIINARISEKRAYNK